MQVGDKVKVISGDLHIPNGINTRILMGFKNLHIPVVTYNHDLNCDKIFTIFNRLVAGKSIIYGIKNDDGDEYLFYSFGLCLYNPYKFPYYWLLFQKWEYNG